MNEGKQTTEDSSSLSTGRSNASAGSPNPSAGSPSLFDPAGQHSRPDAKIVAALERLSRVFRLLLWEEAEPRNLSPLQIQILVFLRHHGASLRRVGQLAAEFQVTPATVSDAVATLESKGLLRKKTAESDRRVSILELTEEGESHGDALSGWAEIVRHHLEATPEEDRETVLEFLLELIASLQRAGLISVARMCVTCRFFGRDEGPGEASPHFCHLLEKPLATGDLRIDCPEHEEIARS